MKVKSVVKSLAAFALAASISLGMANPLVAEAATINDVSTSKPVYGNVVGVNSTSSLNVRSAASTSSAIVASLPYNGHVMVVGQSGNFYRVQYSTTAGSYGYVSKDYLNVTIPDCYLLVDVGSGNLNMRDDPTTGSQIIAKIPNGTYFAYVGKEELDPSHPWYCGVYGNVAGFVAGNYVAMRKFTY